jgi:DNA-binding NarL/FixJ family response regulator
MPIRVLLVDDSPEYIRALSRLLSGHIGIQIAGCAFSARDALKKLSQSPVDLVLMDIAMPQTNGLEATRTIKAQSNPPCVLLLTLYDGEEYRSAARDVCADGLVSKLASDDELLASIYKLGAPSPMLAAEDMSKDDH